MAFAEKIQRLTQRAPTVRQEPISNLQATKRGLGVPVFFYGVEISQRASDGKGKAGMFRIPDF